MKVHTTNYFDTFIQVAEDTKAACGIRPTSKGDKKTVAEMQFDLISRNPYRYTSDDILFQIYADKNELPEAEYEQSRAQFFSKGQACFRASPLTKSYGFGVHCDGVGKIAIFGMETEVYQNFVADASIKKVKAMKSARK